MPYRKYFFNEICPSVTLKWTEFKINIFLNILFQNILWHKLRKHKYCNGFLNNKCDRCVWDLVWWRSISFVSFFETILRYIRTFHFLQVVQKEIFWTVLKAEQEMDKSIKLQLPERWSEMQKEKIEKQLKNQEYIREMLPVTYKISFCKCYRRSNH